MGAFGKGVSLLRARSQALLQPHLGAAPSAGVEGG